MFQERKYTDNTGYLIFIEADAIPITSRIIAELPKKGEYSLANFGINGGYFVKSGYGNVTIRYRNGTIATPLESVRIVWNDGDFADHIWEMKHTYTTSNIDRKLH